MNKCMIFTTIALSLVISAGLVNANQQIASIDATGTKYDIVVNVEKAGKEAITSDRKIKVDAGGEVTVRNGTVLNFKKFPITNIDNPIPVRLMNGNDTIAQLYIWRDENVNFGFLPIKADSVKITADKSGIIITPVE